MRIGVASVIAVIGLTLGVPSAFADPYVPKCIVETTKEAMKDLKIAEDAGKKIATDWCNCFHDAAVKAGQKDTYEDLDTYFATPDGKKLDATCGTQVGWR